MRLNVRAAALTGAFFWGMGVFIFTWWLIGFEGSTGEVTWLGRMYRGYTVSPAGSIIGFAWGFIDGLVSGAIIAWLYNFFSSRLEGTTRK